MRILLLLHSWSGVFFFTSILNLIPETTGTLTALHAMGNRQGGQVGAKGKKSGGRGAPPRKDKLDDQPLSKDPRKWSPSHTCRYLKNNTNLPEEVISIFEVQCIGGDVFIELNKESLRNDLGIKQFGALKTLERVIAECKKQAGGDPNVTKSTPREEQLKKELEKGCVALPPQHNTTQKKHPKKQTHSNKSQSKDETKPGAVKDEG